MIRLFTEDEMLDRWRMHRHRCPPRSDAAVTHTDYLDVDTMMLDNLRAWYRGVLLRAPLSLVGLTDYAPTLIPLHRGEGVFEVALPPEVVRVAEVMMDGWHVPARIVRPDTPDAAAQLNPLSRGGICSPVAVHYPRRLLLYSLDGVEQASLVRLTATADDGTYRLDDSLVDFSQVF